MSQKDSTAGLLTNFGTFLGYAQLQAATSAHNICCRQLSNISQTVVKKASECLVINCETFGTKMLFSLGLILLNLKHTFVFEVKEYVGYFFLT